jgi:putative transposase
MLLQKQAPVASAMHKLSLQYLCYDSRRIRVFLRREGLKVGKEACQRLWAEHGLQVPKKRPRRRIAGSRPRPLATGAGKLSVEL